MGTHTTTGTSLFHLRPLGAAKIKRLKEAGIYSVEDLRAVDIEDRELAYFITGNNRPDRAVAGLRKWREAALNFRLVEPNKGIRQTSKKRRIESPPVLRDMPPVLTAEEDAAARALVALLDVSTMYNQSPKKRLKPCEIS